MSELRKSAKQPIDSYNGIDFADKIKPNSYVCKSIRNFVTDREITDPLVSTKIAPSDRDALILKLKKS